MLVTLEQDLFRKPDSLALYSIFRLGLEGRHVILTDPVYLADAEGPLSAWLSSLPPDEGGLVKGVLDDGIERAAAASATRLGVRIGTLQTSDFDPATLRVNLDDGLQLLRAPLTVLVENRRSDGTFLRALLTKETRSAWERAEAQGWLTIESTGGIDESVKRLEEGHDKPLLHLRWWVLCDRDSNTPQGLSYQSAKVEEWRMKSLAGPVPYGPLKRRMSESYLPLPALDLWVEAKQGPEKTDRRKRVAAFKQMPQSLRILYHMKNGFSSGLSRERKETLEAGVALTSEEILAAFPEASADEQNYLRDLPAEERQHLQKGFGDGLREYFATIDRSSLDDWISHEIPPLERLKLIESVLERI
jgi:hypothetical protein